MPRIFFAEFSAQKKMTASHKTTFLVEARGGYIIPSVVGREARAKRATTAFNGGKIFFRPGEKKKCRRFAFFHFRQS